ncbi:MAG: HAMP domain-containing protein [Treponema sp.]|nr:HAMP domain-containing protein [Treponema sp.]
MLRSIAMLPFYSSPDVALEDKCAQLITIAQSNPEKYVNVAFYDKDGFTIYGDGSKVNFADMDYVKQTLLGKEVVTDPIIWNAQEMEGRTEDGKTVEETEEQILLIYTVPVYSNNQVSGALVALVNGNSFGEIAKGIDMGGGHHPAIIARATEHVFGYAKNEGDSYIKLKELFNSDDFASYKTELLKGNQNRFTMKYPETNNRTIVEYMPIKSTSWSLMAAVPYDYYFAHLGKLNNFSLLSLIVSILIASIILIPIIHIIVKPLKTVSHSINEIASGNADLTKRIEIKSKDEVGSVVEGFNNFTEKLQNILTNIKTSQENLETVGSAMDSSTQDTSASITEIIANIGSVHNQIENQSQSVSQTASAVNQIASNIASLEHLIENQAHGVVAASSAVEEMMGNIDSVNRSVDKMAKSFDKLLVDSQNGSAKQEDVSNKIEQIVTESEMLSEANQVISNIAEQTNLLAMNAAIEAAHAGDAGKGFSVVADEIRKLSETSTAQSKTIGNQLSSIRESIAQVVNASSESNKAFISVSSEIKETDEIVRLIKAAMEEQTVGSQQINQALHDMNDSTTEVRTASHEMSEGNKQILDEVKNLQDSTLVMKQSMDEMSVGAERINLTGTGLQEISSKLKESINQISDEVKLFNV